LMNKLQVVIGCGGWGVIAGCGGKLGK
jgi:hypothetical protein